MSVSLKGSPVHVRPVASADAGAWLRMRCALWPEGSESEHRAEIERFLAGQLRQPLAALVAVASSRDAVGFAELSIRSYAEDCVTDHVAYLEGWYVVPDARRQGVGKALVRAAEEWARSQGCTEFASDALIDNDVSAAAHRALGFEETVRIRCFRKVLGVIGLVILAASCSPNDNPLAQLPQFIAPPADRPKCEPIPAKADVVLPVKGPFTYCRGVFASRETFALMRDSTGRTVWFARSWRPALREKSFAVFDSLSRQLDRRYGPATTCDSLRRVWVIPNFNIQLALVSMAEVVRRPDLELPWRVRFNGQVAAPAVRPSDSPPDRQARVRTPCRVSR